MTISVYQADAFTHEPFKGNPAAVCPLKEWLPDALMQQIAMENNLAETAFIVPYEDGYWIRWFTPTVEVALCGHATLASAHIYFRELNHPGPTIRFFSQSGWLTVTREADGKLTLDFPADTAMPAEEPDGLFEALGLHPSNVFRGKFDYLVEVRSEDEVRNLNPDFKTLSAIPSRGVIVTAKGNRYDFVSRCFFPQTGIDEDPVTGSAHCLLTTYWNQKTGRDHFHALQASARSGEMTCRLKEHRVLMTGEAVTVLKGEIYTG
jgi:PhzF family phenazine biosynthesis protein